MNGMACAFVAGLCAAVSVASARAQGVERCDDMRVIRVDGPQVTVDCGRDGGLARGDHVAFVEPVETDLGDGEVAVEWRESRVGRVVAVSPGRARVELGINERVMVGDQAATTAAPTTDSRLAPPHSRARTTVDLGFHFALPVGARGLGAVLDGRIHHRFGRGFVALRLDPTGSYRYRRAAVAAESDPERSAHAAGAVALVGIDVGPVAFGVGVGFGISTRLLEERRACDTCTPLTVAHGFETGLLVAASARFGVRDGLALELDTAFLTVLRRFEVSRFSARLYVPATSRLTVVASATSGLGAAGVRTYELGFRILRRGDGGAGTRYLVPAVGYLGMAERSVVETSPSSQPRPAVVAEIHGLAAGLTFEARF